MRLTKEGNEFILTSKQDNGFVVEMKLSEKDVKDIVDIVQYYHHENEVRNYIEENNLRNILYFDEATIQDLAKQYHIARKESDKKEGGINSRKCLEEIFHEYEMEGFEDLEEDVIGID